MKANLDLKAELIRRYGSQVEAAKALGIRENRLSYIVRGHTTPSDKERKALVLGLGQKKVNSLLAGAEKSQRKETTT